MHQNCWQLGLIKPIPNQTAIQLRINWNQIIVHKLISSMPFTILHHWGRTAWSCFSCFVTIHAYCRHTTEREHITTIAKCCRVTMASFAKYYLCSVLPPPCCGYILCNVNVIKYLEFCHACLLLRLELQKNNPETYAIDYKTPRNVNAFYTYNMPS